MRRAGHGAGRGRALAGPAGARLSELLADMTLALYKKLCVRGQHVAACLASPGHAGASHSTNPANRPVRVRVGLG